MTRLIALYFVASTSLFSQILPLRDQVKHYPFFKYPGLAVIAKIQGQLDMTLTVQNGHVVAVRPIEGVKELQIPQLAVPAEDFAKQIEFYPGTSIEITLHFIFKITDKEGYNTRMEIAPESNTITIESDRAPFLTLPRKTE